MLPASRIRASLRTRPSIVPFLVGSLVIIVLGSVAGEYISLFHAATTCATHHCTRATAWTALLVTGLGPLVANAFGAMLYAAIWQGFKSDRQPLTARALIFLTLFPFACTSLLFPLLTQLIFVSGASVEDALALFRHLKDALLLLDLLILLAATKTLCRLRWLDATSVLALPSFLFAVLFFLSQHPINHYFV